MQKITEYLNNTAAKFPNKTAFVDSDEKMTFSELREKAYRIASALIEHNLRKKPIVIYLDKNVNCIASMFGVAYSGNFYSVIDTGMPIERIEKIVACLNPAAIITDKKHKNVADNFQQDVAVLMYEDITIAEAKHEQVKEAENRIIGTDILYVLFTSGSTGVPKGVIISHQAVIAYNDWLTATFHIDETTVFGNQTPFYFVMSGLDIFQTIANGCTTYIIPKMAFSFPGMLLEYLRDNKINTLYWVPTALCMLANMGALHEIHLDTLKLVMFGGEVMPSKQLNMWMEEYPDVMFVNQYGPTEMTDICAYYIINRKFESDEAIPIGWPVSHMDLMLLNDENKIVEEGEIGELCGRGPSLASGYYNDPEKSAEAFVQNPLNTFYEEKIYRTGDLVRTNEYGEMVFVSRKDYQIKHLGHRIELGEIETAASSIDGIARVCCLYDVKRMHIVMFYTGSEEERLIYDALRMKIPEYMIPNKIIRLDEMPLNFNGKIDRKKLEGML